ncbi:MAG TPA: PD-(D/E)XK nuclease family protein [Planctomycetaceae bacterium]
MTEQLFEPDEIPSGPTSTPITILDRSDLERYASCPQQAAQVDRKLVSTGGEMATVGNEVHRLFAEAVKSRRIHGTLPHDLRNDLSAGAENSRPDVQPAVIDAVKYATWKFVDILTTLPDSSEKRNPEDLLRFDDGDDMTAQGGANMSGQLAADMEVDGVTARLTCEVDLLMSTVSVEELDLWDWKSGRKHWTATAVRSSFQFQFYPYLIFRNYPVQRVTVRIFMPALSETTAAVTIQRKDMFQIEQRIKSAARLYLAHRNTPIEQVPAWPEIYKCSICDAVRVCPVAAEPLATDPEKLLRQLVVIEAQADSIKDVLKEMVRDGGDLIFAAGTPDAIAFGTGKPKASRATCSVYTPEAVGAHAIRLPRK